MSTTTLTTSFLAKRWWLLVVLMLASHVTLMLTAAILGSGTSGFSAVPGSYARTVQLDALKAEMASASQLGLSINLSAPVQVSDGTQHHVIKLSIHNALEQNLTPETASVTWYPHAQAAAQRKQTLARSADGTFHLLVTRDGFWQFELRGNVNDQAVLIEKTHYVSFPPR